MISNIVILQVGTNMSFYWEYILKHFNTARSVKVLKNANHIRHSHSTLRIFLKEEKRVYSKIYALLQYSLTYMNVCCITCTKLGTGDTVVSKTTQALYSRSLSFGKIELQMICFYSLEIYPKSSLIKKTPTPPYVLVNIPLPSWFSSLTKKYTYYPKRWLASGSFTKTLNVL